MRESFSAGPWPACLLATALAACAAPSPPPSPAPIVSAAVPASVPASSPSGEDADRDPGKPSSQGLLKVVAYAERVRALAPAELGSEIQRLGDRVYSPVAATQLALALGQTRAAPDRARAQALLQRVIADPSSEAQGLQAFARLLSAQIADQRRADEQAERAAQQLRDAQKRIDQLNDRLEAVRAIERSLPGPDKREPAR